MLSRLERDRAKLRQHLVRLRVRYRRQVAHDEDAGISGELEVRSDGDPIAPLQLDPERLDETVAL